jgi:hypothetical protein
MRLGSEHLGAIPDLQLLDAKLAVDGDERYRKSCELQHGPEPL